ncbi:MAG: hypothetical protein R3F20_00990 [Planctomycetota bacterium]
MGQTTKTDRPTGSPGLERRVAGFSSPVDADELEFIQALEDYKRRHERPFPSWSEVLHVLKSLGYAK